LQFFDAFPRFPDRGGLVVDVFTVHHDAWYRSATGPAGVAYEPPDGVRSPTPVPFLTIGPEVTFTFRCALLKPFQWEPVKQQLIARASALSTFEIDATGDLKTFLRSAIGSAGTYHGFGGHTGQGMGRMKQVL